MRAGRESFFVQMARAYQALPLSWLRCLEFPLLKLLGKQKREANLIILLAPPRSGSTLAYQLINHGLKTLYLSNVWNMFYMTPLFGGLISRKLCSQHQSDFLSSRGFVPGLCGPAEGLLFWSYWTGQALSDGLTGMTDRKKLKKRAAYLHSVLGALTRGDHPFVTGYVGHVLHLPGLQELFPNAVYLRLKRDYLSNAYSLLQIRKSITDEWFSVFPAECRDKNNLSLHEQVAAQVYFINRRLDNQLDRNRTLALSYEELGFDPEKIILEIVNFCAKFAINLHRRHPLPQSFPCKKVQPDKDEDASRLQLALQQLENRHGKLK